MKRKTAVLFITALCAAIPLVYSQEKPPEAKKPSSSGSAAVAELKQIENDWVDAVKNRNADKIAEILADNWVGLSWEGKTEDKAKALADVKAPNHSLDSIEMGPMRVRFFGGTAIVTGSDTEKSTANGKDSSGKYVWTDIFVKQDGKWRAVASQTTRVPK